MITGEELRRALQDARRPAGRLFCWRTHCNTTPRPSRFVLGIATAMIAVGVITRLATDPATPIPTATSNSSLTQAPHARSAAEAVSDEPPLQRHESGWLADGNVWVRPLTPEGQRVSSVGVAWATTSERQVALQQVMATADGWLVVAPPPLHDRDTSLWSSDERVQEAIAERDRQDSSRADSPLVVPDGSTTVDTDTLDVDGVVDAIVRLLGAARNGHDVAGGSR